MPTQNEIKMIYLDDTYSVAKIDDLIAQADELPGGDFARKSYLDSLLDMKIAGWETAFTPSDRNATLDERMNMAQQQEHERAKMLADLDAMKERQQQDAADKKAADAIEEMKQAEADRAAGRGRGREIGEGAGAVEEVPLSEVRSNLDLAAKHIGDPNDDGTKNARDTDVRARLDALEAAGVKTVPMTNADRHMETGLGITDYGYTAERAVQQAERRLEAAQEPSQPANVQEPSARRETPSEAQETAKTALPEYAGRYSSPVPREEIAQKHGLEAREIDDADGWRTEYRDAEGKTAIEDRGDTVRLHDPARVAAAVELAKEKWPEGVELKYGASQTPEERKALLTECVKQGLTVHNPELQGEIETIRKTQEKIAERTEHAVKNADGDVAAIAQRSIDRRSRPAQEQPAAEEPQAQHEQQIEPGD